MIGEETETVLLPEELEAVQDTKTGRNGVVDAQWLSGDYNNSSNMADENEVLIENKIVTENSPFGIPTKDNKNDVVSTTTPSLDVLPVSALDCLADRIASCLLLSDAKRDDGWDGASTGWTSWIDESSCAKVQGCMDQIMISTTTNVQQQQQQQQQQQNQLNKEQQTQPLQNPHLSDEKSDMVVRWKRWIQASPSPMILDATQQLRQKVEGRLQQQYDRAANQLTTAGAGNLENDDDKEQKHAAMIHSLSKRIGCRFLALPSGSTFAHNLQTPPGGLVFGTVLWGGVTRYRLIGSSSSTRAKRKAGERCVILTDEGNRPAGESWLQYGGPERNYEAVDMGHCLVMEVTLLPDGLAFDTENDNDEDVSYDVNAALKGDVAITFPSSSAAAESTLDLDKFLQLFVENQDGTVGEKRNDRSLKPNPNSASSDYFNGDILEASTSFHSMLGGLGPQIDEIVRRVLDGRVFVSVAKSTTNRNSNNNTTENSVDEDDDDNDETERDLEDERNFRRARQEMMALADLGLKPVRGLLLYGPPGCGKTALAREIAHVLGAASTANGARRAPPPIIVSAPELLDRWVGGSEKLVRDLFGEAEVELKQCNGDATLSSLHVIVIDEIDAVFRMRCTSDSGGEIARASAVNQILAKLDGVNALDNILLIGMTNRKELLDPALLRPGRLEVHIEIPRPSQEGRREILKIHFDALRRRGRLSQPLCRAIDGRDSDPKTSKGFGRKIRSFFSALAPRREKPSLGSSQFIIKDLAADQWTGDFSGADIAGLVRCAGSIALARSRSQGDTGLDNFSITMEDVVQALQEVKG